MRKKIAIIGAGISGLSVGRMLFDKGYEIEIFEQSPSVGGLCKSRIVDGMYLDIGGGHIFNARDAKVKDWVFSLYPEKNWYKSVRNAKVFLEDEYIDYPIEKNYNVAGENIVPKNYQEWLLSKFGRELCELYFFPFERKKWQYPLDKLGFAWCEKRMPVDGKDTVHKDFFYPQTGGIQSLIDAIREPIKNCIHCNWIMMHDYLNELISSSKYETCILTIPLPELAWCKIVPESIRKELLSLRYCGHTAVYRIEEVLPYSWVYFPGPEKYYKKSYVTNFSREPTNVVCYEHVNYRFDNGFLDKYAFPLQTLGLSDKMKAIKEWANKNGIVLLGRFAEWKYYTMDDCIRRAMEVADGVE